MYAALHADRCSHIYSLRHHLIALGQGHVKHILGDFSGGGACRRDTAPCPLQPAIRVDQKLVCCWRFGTGEKRLYPGIRRYRDRLGVIRRGRLEIDPAHARWQAWKAPSPCGRGLGGCRSRSLRGGSPSPCGRGLGEGVGARGTISPHPTSPARGEEPFSPREACACFESCSHSHSCSHPSRDARIRRHRKCLYNGLASRPCASVICPGHDNRNSDSSRDPSLLVLERSSRRR